MVGLRTNALSMPTSNNYAYKQNEHVRGIDTYTQSPEDMWSIKPTMCPITKALVSIANTPHPHDTGAIGLQSRGLGRGRRRRVGRGALRLEGMQPKAAKREVLGWPSAPNGGGGAAAHSRPQGAAATKETPASPPTLAPGVYRSD